MKIHTLNRRDGLLCDWCLEEVYPEELVHFIDGYIICPDCFFDFVFDLFSDRLMTVREIQEKLRDAGSL